MLQQFNLYGVFHNEEHLISVSVSSIEAQNIETAKTIAYEKEMGEVFFDINAGNFFHSIDGEIKTLDDTLIILCEVCDPRKNYKHELIMGIPVHDAEDYRKITLNELIKATFKVGIENNKSLINFECIAYGVHQIV